MAFRIQKLNFNGIGRIDLNHGPNLSGGEALPWPLLKEGHHIKKFYRAILHVIYLTRSVAQPNGKGKS